MNPEDDIIILFTLFSVGGVMVWGAIGLFINYLKNKDKVSYSLGEKMVGILILLFFLSIGIPCLVLGIYKIFPFLPIPSFKIVLNIMLTIAGILGTWFIISSIIKLKKIRKRAKKFITYAEQQITRDKQEKRELATEKKDKKIKTDRLVRDICIDF